MDPFATSPLSLLFSGGVATMGYCLFYSNRRGARLVRLVIAILLFVCLNRFIGTKVFHVTNGKAQYPNFIECPGTHHARKFWLKFSVPVGANDNRLKWMADDFDECVLKFWEKNPWRHKFGSETLPPLVCSISRQKWRKKKRENIWPDRHWCPCGVWSPPLPFFAHFWSQLIPSPPFYGTFGKRWGEEPRGSSALIFHNQWLFYSNTLLYINFQTSRPAKSVSPKMFPRPACQMNGLQYLKDNCVL